MPGARLRKGRARGSTGTRPQAAASITSLRREVVAKVHDAFEREDCLLIGFDTNMPQDRLIRRL